MVTTFQVTLGASATQVKTTQFACAQVVFQNNGNNAMRIGGSNVSASLGINLPQQGGSLNAGPLVMYNVDLSNFWVAGTAADVLDVMFIQ